MGYIKILKFDACACQFSCVNGNSIYGYCYRQQMAKTQINLMQMVGIDGHQSIIKLRSGRITTIVSSYM